MATMPLDGAMPMNDSMPTNGTAGDHAGHGAHDGHGVAGAAMDHMMSPYLFTRTTDFFVLFREAHVRNGGGFAGALIASFCFAALATLLYEALRVHEAKFVISSRFVLRLAAACMHAFRQLLHYVAMLIVMTMNVWLILAVIVGHGVGFLLYSYALGPRLGAAASDGKPAAGTDGCPC